MKLNKIREAPMVERIYHKMTFNGNECIPFATIIGPLKQ